jgi:uncharacterized membrane protein
MDPTPPVNPYQPPAVTAVRAAESQGKDSLIPDGRSVSAGRGWEWIAEAWALFVQSPLIWIVNLVIFVVIVLASSAVPFVGGLILDVFLFVLIAGFMIGADKQHRGEALEVEHLFGGFKQNFQPLLIVGLIYTAIIIAIVVVVLVLMLVLLGATGVFGAMMSGDSDALATQIGAIGLNGVLMFLVIILVAMFLYVPVVMLIWFAPALVVFHNVPPMAAMRMSFMGCLKNILPFLVNGVIFLPLFIIGAVPIFLGWLVVLPLMYASIYTSYRDIFINQAD